MGCGVSKGWREAAPVSMAMAIGGSRRRTLAPRHQAVGPEAGKPDRVAKALAGCA